MGICEYFFQLFLFNRGDPIPEPNRALLVRAALGSVGKFMQAGSGGAAAKAAAAVNAKF